jgi:hypothetical protein
MPAPRPSSSVALLLLAAAFLAACARDLPPPPPPASDPPPPAPAPASAPAFQPPAVAAPLVTEGTVTRIDARERVALTGPRVDAKPGDWLLENAGSVAVVSAEGKVIDLGEKGGRDEITAIDPTVFLGLDAAHVEVASIEPAGEGGHVLRIVRRVLEKPLLFHELISFSGDLLRIETAVTAASPGATVQPVVVTLGERIGWGNVPTWVEGHGFCSNTRAGTFGADFVARESFGVAYALGAETGRLVARFDAPDPGFHEEAATGETPEIVSLDAPTTHRVVLVSHARGSLGRAAAALPSPARVQRVPVPEGLPPTARVEVARCGRGSQGPTPYARFLAGEREAALPAGCFQMRLAAPGHLPTPWFALTAAAGRTLPPAGTLRFAVTDKIGGGPLPARILVRGEKGTADPDWGDDPDAGAALNVVYSETGAGERPLPPGRYRVTVDRGFEYTAHEKVIEVVADRVVTVGAVLERVVDTRGFISADMHLHAMPSPDATQPLADRVRALVASGVEVGVATDHNKVTDYRPVLDELKVRRWMASVVGDEVTTRAPAWGHFNVFPLAAGSEPLAYAGVTPRALFAAGHSAGPLGADGIVQVNHPRMSRIGYFDLLRFERDDPAGWAARVPLADLGFDALEVFNGDHYALIPKVEDCMRDWYALLDTGHRVTATGNSDSHKLTFHEPGVPRNLVAVPDDDPAHFDERAFVAAVRKGRVVVSSGPFIRFEVGGKGVGETVPAGDLPISIQVDAPPWVDVDRVELVRRGEVVAVWTAPFPKGPHRFEVHTTRPLAAGDWVLAVARGTRPMSYLHRPNARPFAFTNPVWVE